MDIVKSRYISAYHFGQIIGRSVAASETTKIKMVNHNSCECYDEMYSSNRINFEPNESNVTIHVDMPSSQWYNYRVFS